MTKIFFVILLLVVGAAGWLTYDNIRPRPLGNQMHYLGKEDYGNILGFDSKPYSVYYYGTDMNSEALKSYFNATPEALDAIAFDHASFIGNNNESFFFTYHSEPSTSFKTQKKYVVSIVNDQYNIAKKYLK